jgi:hypothetical protein
LLLGLSLVAWERHPFPDDCSPRIVLGFHLSNSLKSLSIALKSLLRQRLLLDDRLGNAG